MRKIYCKQNLLKMIENKWDTKHIHILPAPKKGAMENIGKGVRYYSSMSLLRNLLNVKHYAP